MANTNSPFGLRLLGRQNDTTPAFGLGADPLKIASNNTTKIARGDALQRLTTGYVTAVGAAAVVASQWVGVFMGCQYLSISQGKRVVSPFWPGGDATGDVDVSYLPLSGYPDARFVIQATSTNFVFEDIGENCDIAYTAPTIYGSWGKSGLTLDKSTINVTATLPFRIMGLWSQYQGRNMAGQPGTDNASNYNWVVVEFNAMQETGNA
jgi:hypothetical protein